MLGVCSVLQIPVITRDEDGLFGWVHIVKEGGKECAQVGQESLRGRIISIMPDLVRQKVLEKGEAVTPCDAGQDVGRGGGGPGRYRQGQSFVPGPSR